MLIFLLSVCLFSILVTAQCAALNPLLSLSDFLEILSAILMIFIFIRNSLTSTADLCSISVVAHFLQKISSKFWYKIFIVKKNLHY